MPIDFTEQAQVKTAVRTFTTPIADAATFDGIVTSLLVTESNPLGEASITSESYSRTYNYLDSEGKTKGSITIKAKTRAEFAGACTAFEAASAIHTEYDTTAQVDAEKEAWVVKMKFTPPTTGETYYLYFTREKLVISSYEDDAVLATVETWADTVTALN